MEPTLISSALLFVKILIIFGLIVYAAFAAIIVRQEQLMTSVMDEGFDTVLKLLVFVHLAASVAIIFFAFILL
jgi:type III secretory pathway component EscS